MPKFSSDFNVGNMNNPIDILIRQIQNIDRQFKIAEERERKAEERERKAEERKQKEEQKAEERERKAEERRQLMIKQMEIQRNLTTSIQDLVGKIDELENIIRNQSGNTNPAQNNNSITGIVSNILGGDE